MTRTYLLQMIYQDDSTNILHFIDETSSFVNTQKRNILSVCIQLVAAMLKVWKRVQ